MTRMPKFPKVIYLKTKATSRAFPTATFKQQPSPNRSNSHHASGKICGSLAKRTESLEPDSIRGAWIGLRHFGYHVVFDNRDCLKVNGKPTSLDELMKLTNKVRRENCLPPVGRKKEWLE